MYPDITAESLVRYVRNPTDWREAVSEYYRITRDMAKRVLPTSLSGYAIAVGARRFSKDVLPMVSALSNESREFRRRIVADMPHVRNHFAVMGRKSPDLTTFSYAVAEKEDANLANR